MTQAKPCTSPSCWIVVIVIVFAAGIFNAGIAQSAEQAPGITAFVNVNVVPMNQEKVLSEHVVIIREGRIAEVGPAEQTEIPAGAVRIDGSGRYLMPGLTEMHGHIPTPDNREYLTNVLFLYLSNGVTTVRNMAGHPYHLELRERIQKGEMRGPTIYTASPWLSEQNMPSPREASRVVEEYQEAGFDLLKIGSIPPETYDQMAAKANEIGMPFGGHIPEGVGLGRALEVRQASIDHLDRYIEYLVPEDVDSGTRDGGFFGSGLVELADTSRIPAAVQKTIKTGTWNVPTLSLVEHLASPEPAEEMIRREEMQYMPQGIREDWVEAKKNFKERDDFRLESANRLVQIRRMLLKSLHDSGAPIALGSDAPQFFNVPGFSIHHEMNMMVKAGLTPYEVLVSGTRNPARYFSAGELFGTVEEGRRADLILLEANPLEDIAHVKQRAGVMVRGKWMPEDEIQKELARIAAANETGN